MAHTVAVVTRTHNRTVFLKRVLACVAAQTHRDLVHVVVNDAGDPEAVAACIAELPGEMRRRVVQIDNAVSAGREAAVNPGFAKARELGAESVLVLDDDDTIAPSFLEDAVTHLDSQPGDIGVSCLVDVVRERVLDDAIEKVGRFPLTDGRRQITLFELLKNNFVPPVSLLFRTSALERLDGWREDLPVLADWDFNLRLVMLGPIARLDRTLAFWHHRETNDEDLGNSVVVEADNHRDYALVIRDDYLRRLGLPDRGGAAEQDWRALALPLLIAGETQEVLAQVESARAAGSDHLESVLASLTEQLRELTEQVRVIDDRQHRIEQALRRVKNAFNPKHWGSGKQQRLEESGNEPPSL